MYSAHWTLLTRTHASPTTGWVDMGNQKAFADYGLTYIGGVLSARLSQAANEPGNTKYKHFMNVVDTSGTRFQPYFMAPDGGKTTLGQARMHVRCLDMPGEKALVHIDSVGYAFISLSTGKVLTVLGNFQDINFQCDPAQNSHYQYQEGLDDDLADWFTLLWWWVKFRIFGLNP